MSLMKLSILVLFLTCLTIPAYAADTQWAVVIGISDYKNLPEDQWLKFAHEDARSFMDHLKSRYVGVPPENVKFLLNQDATSENIKDALGSWLPDRVAAGDTVYIYFAGHGVVDKTDQAYFVTYDTNPDRLYATAYPMLEMKRIMSNLPHRHLILISDACKSGSIGKEARTSRDLEVVKINDHFKGIVRENADVLKSDFVLTAAGSNEKSYESADWGGGHGVFTYNLIQGLKGAADRDSSGIVDANEIYDYVRDTVRKATDDKQHPVAATSNFDGNLVLSVLKDSAAPASTVVTPVSAPRPAVVPAAIIPTGTILVTTNVSNTRVLIDSEEKGSLDPASSRLFTVAAGQHIFEAVRDGYIRQQKIVDVQPGRQIVQAVTLEPAAPSLAPDLEIQLTNARKQLGTRQDADGMKSLQAIFTQLLITKNTRGLLADEEVLATAVFLALGDQLLKKKQPLNSHAENYLQIFPVLPDDMATKATPDLMFALVQAAATLTVEVETPLSTVEVDANSLGIPTGPRTLRLRPGPHKVRAQRPGYTDWEMALDLVAGETRSVTGRLRLAKINVLVLSQTPGVQLAGSGPAPVSFKPLSEIRGNLTNIQLERLNAELQRRNLDNQIHVALLKDLAPDTAKLDLRFTRDKYSIQQGTIDLASHADQIYNDVGDYIWDGMVKLEQLMGSLDVASTPAGADVFVNNKNIGKTPLSGWRAEIGDYDVVINIGVWKSSHRISIRDKETTKIDARDATLRAPVVFLGAHSPVVDTAKLRDVENSIAQRVPRAFSNYRGEVQNYSRYEYTRDFLLGTTGAVSPVRGSPIQRLTEMKDRFGTELFLFGYFPTELDFLSNKIKFYLFSSFTTRPDIREVQLDKPESVDAFFKELDSAVLTDADLLKPYIGLTALDTQLTGHEVVVLKVDDGGPAALAGLQKDDVILSINGETPEASKLSEWVSRNPAGSELRIEVQDAGGRKLVSFNSTPLPRFVVTSGTRTYVNSILAQLEWMRRQAGTDASEKSNIILLNQALAYIAEEDWSNALTVLNRFATDAPKASLLRPAVYYYKGFCFEQLKDRAAARQWYEMASKEKDTLLQSELAFDFQTLGTWRVDYLK
jgi:hypothetical protein